MAREGTCRPCLVTIRLGQDEPWIWAEQNDQKLESGRPRQLAVEVPGLALPKARPVRTPGTSPGRRAAVPAWVKARQLLVPIADDPRICPPQIPGQLGLFPTPLRHFTAAHRALIADRFIPGFAAVAEQLQQMAAERQIKARVMWTWRLGGFARLALAGRDPDQEQVRTEALKDLLYNGPIVGQALQRAGLLAPAAPHRLLPPPLATPASPGRRAYPQGRGQCVSCLAWANDRRMRCVPCASWITEARRRGLQEGDCARCRRHMLLFDGQCRMCRIVLAETEVDTARVGLDGGDQLWFAGPHAPGLAVGRTSLTPAARKGRFADKRRRARAALEAGRRLSDHLVDPAQSELFPAPARDWSRLDPTLTPALSPEASTLIEDFTCYLRGRGWSVHAFNGTLRTLRLLTGHLGARVPIQETDIRALASLHPNLHGPRLINYLRLRGLLAGQAAVAPELRRARTRADRLTHPAFTHAVHTFIDVLLGGGRREGTPRRPKTIENYVTALTDTLNAWAAAGLTNPRQVTTKHIEDALDPLSGHPAHRLHTALRALFRALKRERLVFRDPARNVSLPSSRSIPQALPSDRVDGLLDRLTSSRDRLMVALVAIHALQPGHLTTLHRTDLDLTRGRLKRRRPGQMDHVIYLDAFTLRLLTAWEHERRWRWPDSSNPHLFVSRHTAVDDSAAPISAGQVQNIFRRAGVPAGVLRADRICDEARHNADPVRLMDLFGISNLSATQYVLAAHPEKRADSIAP
ncbi:hypothetical protein [Streptomyces chartreusis]|uniref:hypothetical protein n=1 Tax=Streptomyces chartreusis TaxID=1969 RepID=UPI00362B013F